MLHNIETAKAVWSEPTHKGHEGGEARIAEPPASGQRTFQDIDTVEAVWSGAT
jgi:hypothetical protein